MKMFDIMGEGQKTDWVLDKAKHLDPIFKRGYSNPADAAAAKLAKGVNKEAEKSAAMAADLRQQAAELQRQAATLRTPKDVHPTTTKKVRDPSNTSPVKPSELATKKDLEAGARDLKKNADELDAGTTFQQVADPDKYTLGQRATQGFGATSAGLGAGTEIFVDDPAKARADIADIIRSPLKGAGALLSRGNNDDEDDGSSIPSAPKESVDFSDILKLAGLKSITERDNIAGIIKPKEIIALHESKQIDECGMMPNTPNTPATLNISATAGSGEEVANMLAAIMNLAGVKPVTGDMLGGAEPPMPIVKAIDIISKGSSDHKHDHDHDEPLIGMGEEYANTPENPTKVPDLDTNQMAYQPNSAEPGDRMDGTMPKGFPTMTKESLYQAYNQFKNGQ
jgi:hypothetical protein